jgi:prepilin-type N-terminal cleavage/methylation domain-containing protein
MKNKISDKKAGFTLIELIIVTGIIIIVLSVSFSALLQSQSFQVYNNTFTKLYSLINNARSLAISGKGQLDFTDFDLDGRTTSPADYVTPANYAIHFNTGTVSATVPNVALFADINPPQAGTINKKGQFDPGLQYNQGNDLILDRLNLPNLTVLKITDGDGATPEQSSIFYSPNYADITFENLTFGTSPFLTIALADSSLGLCKQIIIHKLAGIPEISSCTTP